LQQNRGTTLVRYARRQTAYQSDYTQALAMHTRDRTGDSVLLRRWMVPAVSLLFTFFFFHEYFVRRVYIPFDLPSFHDPLADYAFIAIRHGRFPEWDPTDYAGMPFAANPQAALFYPGTWVMFAANWRRQHLSYWTLEVFVLAHIWIAWMLCFAWMRRRLSMFASACGAAIFAYGGYMVMSLQHLGVIVGCTWIPLGLMGIDEAEETSSWRPLWKVVAASALAFLGGYTPTWFVMAICFVSYAACRRGGWKWGLESCAAIGASLGVVMIQLLPSMRLSALRLPELRYGVGIRDPAFYIPYFIPNFYDFGPHVNVLANYGSEYLYLGVPGIVGLALLVCLRRPAGAWSAVPLAGMFTICAVIVTNPLNLVSSLVVRSTLIGQLCRDHYFLAGLTAAGAPLAAMGIDRFLKREGKSSPKTFLPKIALALIACLAAFSAQLVYIWSTSDFAPGWAGAWDVGILALLFVAALWLLRNRRGPIGIALAAVLLLTIGIDYKVHGTWKRFNGTLDHGWRTDWMPGMNGDTYRELQANSVYRISVDQTGPLPADLRHFGLTTPQGWDPFLTTAYSKFIKTTGRFITNWDLEIDPTNERGLHTLGIGYFITAEQRPQFAALQANPKFRLLQPNDSYYKVFELIDKRPPYGFELGDATIERTRWEPERREFTVRTSAAGKFYLSEQWNPGWSARLDGRPVLIQRWNGAFQSISLQPGEHRVDFEFKDRGLRAGAAVSLATLLGLFAAYRKKLRG
jgi:hypothetical protein